MADSVKVYSKSISEITSSIKELQRQIQVLKDYMAGLSVGSEEFKKAGEQAKQLQDKITAINDSVKGVDRSLPSVKNLRDEMKSLKDQMAGVEEGSDAFYEIANKAGALKHQLDEINQTVRGASQDFGDMLSNSMAAMNGIIGGFTAAQAAMNMFGTKSEELVKIISKLQNLTAIGQSVSQIDNAIKAVAKLNKAITGTTTVCKALRTILTPKWLAGITVALSALYVAWEKWGKKVDETNSYLETNIQKQKQQVQELNNELAIRKRSGVYSDAENLEFEVQAREKLIKSIQDQNKSMESQNKLQENIAKRAMTYNVAGQLVIDTDRRKKAKEIIDANNKSIQTNNEELEKQTKELESVKNELFITTEAQKLATSAKQTDTKVTYDNQKSLYILRQELVKINEQIRGLIQPAKPINKPLQELPTEIDQINTKLLQTELRYVSGQSTIDEYYTNLIGYEELKLEYLERGTDEYYQQAIAVEKLKKEYQDLQQSNVEVKAGLMDYVNIGSVGLSSLGNALSGLADLQDTTTKEGIQKQADLQYAAAVMNTANAIIGAWTSSMSLPAPASFIMAGLQTAAATTMGGIQIAKVAKAAQQAGANLSGGSSTSVSSSAIGSLSAPIQYTSDVNSSKVEDTIKNTKIYVSVTDINDVQDRVRTQVTENKY